MTADKNEKNGFYTFLVILSALGILAIIIAVGFAFFYPGIADNNETPHLSVNNFPFQRKADQPDIGSPEETLSGTEENNQPEGISADPDSEEVTLDSSEALIDSLMSEKDLQGEGNLHIHINDNEKEERTAEEKPVASVTPAAVKKEPRYETVIKEVYWIQIASFPNSVKAEELRDILKSKNIDSTIQTRNVNDKLYYRVRIGAFTSKAEVDNFESLLQDIPEITETQIYTTRVEERILVDS